MNGIVSRETNWTTKAFGEIGRELKEWRFSWNANIARETLRSWANLLKYLVRRPMADPFNDMEAELTQGVHLPSAGCFIRGRL